MAKLWLCIAASVSIVASGAGDCGTDCPVEDDGSALLQHRQSGQQHRLDQQQQEQQRPQQSYQQQQQQQQQAHTKCQRFCGKKAITFQGGGWSSVTMQAAVFSGMLNASSLKSVEQLMSTFDIISTNSGGSWFTSSLIYSQNFNQLLAKMAANPTHAKEIYDTEYIQAWFSKATNTDGPLSDLALLMRALNETAVGDTVYWAKFVETKGSWKNFIEAYLMDTTHGDISASTDLSSPLPWAKGVEKWLCVNSIVLPRSNSKYQRAARHHSGLSRRQMFYSVQGAAVHLPVFLPARFEVPLGGDSTSGSGGLVTPTRFGAPARVQWTKENSFGLNFNWRAPNLLGDFASLSDVKKLPINGVVAASSASLGGNIVVGLEDALFSGFGQQLGPRLAVWVAPNSHAPFTEVQDIMRWADRKYSSPSSLTLHGMARAGAFALVDGYYTDNSGIGHAVQAGATTVVAFCSWANLEKILSTDDGSSDAVDFIEHTKAWVPHLYMPIFANRTTDVLDAIHGNFINATKGKFFTLAAGELELVTRSNAIFGIDAGISIKLQMILYDSFLGPGQLTDFNDFSTEMQNALVSVMYAIRKGGPFAELLEKFFT